jgi:hypothetical protein
MSGLVDRVVSDASHKWPDLSSVSYLLLGVRSVKRRVSRFFDQRGTTPSSLLPALADVFVQIECRMSRVDFNPIWQFYKQIESNLRYCDLLTDVIARMDSPNDRHRGEKPLFLGEYEAIDQRQKEACGIRRLEWPSSEDDFEELIYGHFKKSKIRFTLPPKILFFLMVSHVDSAALGNPETHIDLSEFNGPTYYHFAVIRQYNPRYFVLDLRTCSESDEWVRYVFGKKSESKGANPESVLYGYIQDVREMQSIPEPIIERRKYVLNVYIYRAKIQAFSKKIKEFDKLCELKEFVEDEKNDERYSCVMFMQTNGIPSLRFVRQKGQRDFSVYFCTSQEKLVNRMIEDCHVKKVKILIRDAAAAQPPFTGEFESYHTMGKVYRTLGLGRDAMIFYPDEKGRYHRLKREDLTTLLELVVRHGDSWVLAANGREPVKRRERF